MMWWGHGFSWGGLLTGGLVMLLFWGGLIALVVLVARTFLKSGSRPRFRSASSGDTALDILKKRYAGGEIDKAKYEEMRQNLESR